MMMPGLSELSRAPRSPQSTLAACTRRMLARLAKSKCEKSHTYEHRAGRCRSGLARSAASYAPDPTCVPPGRSSIGRVFARVVTSVLETTPVTGTNCENLRSQHVANVHNLAVGLRQRIYALLVKDDGLGARRVQDPLDSRSEEKVMTGVTSGKSGVSLCEAGYSGDHVGHAFTGVGVREGDPLVGRDGFGGTRVLDGLDLASDLV